MKLASRIRWCFPGRSARRVSSSTARWAHWGEFLRGPNSALERFLVSPNGRFGDIYLKNCLLQNESVRLEQDHAIEECIQLLIRAPVERFCAKTLIEPSALWLLRTLGSPDAESWRNR